MIEAPASDDFAATVSDDDIELVILLTQQGDWSLAEIADALELETVLVIDILHRHRDCFFEDEDGAIH